MDWKTPVTQQLFVSSDGREGGCDFYADELLLAGFLCYLAPRVCVCVCRLCMERESLVPGFPFHNAFHLNQKFECTESVRCLTEWVLGLFSFRRYTS
jgi:hypothetical protein